MRVPLEKLQTPVDLLIAGPPCPPWAGQGNKRSIADPRAKVFMNVVELERVQILGCDNLPITDPQTDTKLRGRQVVPPVKWLVPLHGFSIKQRAKAGAINRPVIRDWNAGDVADRSENIGSDGWSGTGCPRFDLPRPTNDPRDSDSPFVGVPLAAPKAPRGTPSPP